MVDAIQTLYAGCRFRSRLEARWAVFFDTLGIPWEYEPEGYLVGLSERSYLPDFYLERGLWCEVKGDLDQLDYGLAIDSVDYGGSTALPGIEDGRGGLLLLSTIPRPVADTEPVFVGLTHHEGAAVAPFLFSQTAFDLEKGDPYPPFRTVESGGGGSRPVDEDVKRTITDPPRVIESSGRVNRALAKARSARFEHDAREQW